MNLKEIEEAISKDIVSTLSALIEKNNGEHSDELVVEAYKECWSKYVPIDLRVPMASVMYHVDENGKRTGATTKNMVVPGRQMLVLEKLANTVFKRKEIVDQFWSHICLHGCFTTQEVESGAAERAVRNGGTDTDLITDLGDMIQIIPDSKEGVVLKVLVLKPISPIPDQAVVNQAQPAIPHQDPLRPSAGRLEVPTGAKKSIVNSSGYKFYITHDKTEYTSPVYYGSSLAPNRVYALADSRKSKVLSVLTEKSGEPARYVLKAMVNGRFVSQVGAVIKLKGIQIGIKDTVDIDLERKLESDVVWFDVLDMPELYAAEPMVQEVMLSLTGDRSFFNWHKVIDLPGSNP